MSTEPKSYKDTLNLPVTKFDMKANLAVREPKIQAKWKEEKLYARIREARAGRPVRVLHDGPPYANGDIHMGHLLNKVLKDIVVRYLTLRGYDSPYVPGWDCHGLPIEHRVVKDLGSKAANMAPAEIRRLCHEDAMKWVGVQSKQFQRLGVEGDWENPYLTLDPRYEAGIIEVLGDLVKAGYVDRRLKPIHWCVEDRTALAEAELEYSDETSPSIYVNFPMLRGVPESFGPGPWNVMIWTTTPWTLPANVAIAAHPDLTYAGIRYVDPTSGTAVQAILAADLVAKVMALRDVREFVELGRCKGKDLEGAVYRHVFIDRESPIVLANYVSVEDGTGLVHTAPGHGADDYKTGVAYDLPTLSPVDEAGRFNSEAPADLVGKKVFAANPEIVETLKSLGSLYHSFSFKHSYPHCWRCKKPVIFRATEQWFIDVDHNDLRKRTLDEINNRVRWQPSWGRNRIEAMVSLRPDWCISRQRSWGVPIPALGCLECGRQTLTAETVRHFSDLFRREGADAWFNKPVEELTPPGLACSKCGGTRFRKEGDILDVWFESGSSHRGVLAEGFRLGYPAFMYLEGSDQHRGWFQSSILTAVGSTGRAPFETVLTHGFIVDDSGRKMSKSLGNVISAVKATEQYGADVLRLYVAGLDYADDIRMSERGIKEMSDSYRKIRNTFRFLLGNLEDYAKSPHAEFDPTALLEIDRWALGRLNALIREVTDAYEAYEYYRVYQKVYQFCAVELSSFYLDVLKDRLYAEAPAGLPRRSAQFVLARLHDVLARLLAPIIPHTAEELWEYVPDVPSKTGSVHYSDWPEPDPRWDDSSLESKWTDLLKLREVAYVALEGMRKDKLIGSGQEATVTVRVDAETAASLDPELLATVLIVSEVEIRDDGSGAPTVFVAKSTRLKCERCWNYRASVGGDPEHPGLCKRCSVVIREIAG